MRTSLQRTSQTPSYAHLADWLARLHFVPPNELGSAALHLMADWLARLHFVPSNELGSAALRLMRARLIAGITLEMVEFGSSRQPPDF
jgi:hypothetical protein